MNQEQEWVKEFNQRFVVKTTDGQYLISDTNMDGLITAEDLRKFIQSTVDRAVEAERQRIKEWVDIHRVIDIDDSQGKMYVSDLLNFLTKGK
jgi:hypothetical protein